MVISNITRNELERALEEVNKRYDNNIIWNNFQSLNKKGTRFRVTLRVRDSKGKGARRGISGRRLVSACWHVHGHFFEELFKLNPDVIIHTRGRIIEFPSSIWIDIDVGSLISPVFMSELCDCE